jgi:hypothetical protein
MPFRSFLPRLALAAAMLVPFAGGVAHAETVTDKPRLVVLLPPNAFTTKLKNELVATRRFDLVEKSNLKGLLQQKRISLSAKLSVEQSRQALAIAGADMVLDGSVQSGSGLRVTGRLFDLRNGEITRDLSLLGEANDTEVLAKQLAAFVRHSAPIRCLVKDMNEDTVVLDLGAMDGVVPGSKYKVFRYPQNLKPREIGAVRVTKVDPFASSGEVESTASGITLESGDVLVEQTSAYVLSP